MRARVFAALTVVAALGCGSAVEVAPRTLSQSGGELRIWAELGTQAGVVVLIDGVAAQAVVRESDRVIRVRVPALPRSGPVDVELLSEGVHVTKHGALKISAPRLAVEP